MDLGRILFGAAFLAMGYSTLSKGAEHIQKGLSHKKPQKGLAGTKRRGARGLGRVERDPGPRSWGKPMGRIQNAAGKVELYEVRNLDQRIDALRDRVRRGKVDPTVIAWARRQVTGKCANKPGGWCVPEKDTVAEIKAIFDGIRRDVRYTSDVVSVDTYGHPKRTLAQRAGDCDDVSTLACSALLAIGIPCRFKVVQTRDASTWSHIYVLASASKTGQGPWIPLDPSVPVKAGWEVPASHVAASRVFEVT